MFLPSRFDVGRPLHHGADVPTYVIKKLDALDRELIDQLLSKSRLTSDKAWETVYQTFYDAIRDMVVKHNGTEDDAVDVFQDGLLVLHRSLINGSFRTESSLQTFLFSICKNLWFKEYNRKGKEAMLQPELIIELRQNFDYLVNVEIVGLLMSELGDDCRRILIEYYYNDRSMSELMQMFNVNSIQAAKNKKWRCLNHLTKLFKEKGVTPTWS